MEINLPAVKQFHVTKQRDPENSCFMSCVSMCVPASFSSSHLISSVRLSLEDKRRENQLYPEVGFSKMKASVPCQRLPHGRKTELWRHLCSWLTVTDLRVYCNCPAANTIWLLLLSADLTQKRRELNPTESSWIKIRYSYRNADTFSHLMRILFVVKWLW